MAGVDLEELGLESSKEKGPREGIVLNINNAFGNGGQFEDLIAVEDFLDKRVNMKEALDYKLHCKRSGRLPDTELDHKYRQLIHFYVYNQLDIDKELANVEEDLLDIELYTQDQPREMTEEKKQNIEKKKKLKEDRKKMEPKHKLREKQTELRKKREQIVQTFREALSQLKEIQFIEDLGMDRDVALQLDIPKRKQLEEIFPVLQQFNILCFKPDSSIQRKAFIYHKRENEKEYLEAMKSLLNEHNRRFNNPLNSTMKISFRGKYIVKVNKQIYHNFHHTIKAILGHHKVKFNVVETNLKTELHLQGNENQPRAVQTAYEDIIDLLKAEEFFYDESEDGKGKKDIYEYYAIFSTEGDNQVQHLNNLNSGRLLIETNPRFKKIIIRGGEKERAQAKNELRQM